MAPTFAVASRPAPGFRSSTGRFALAGLLILAALAFQPRFASAQDFSPGNYYWYVPEHEKQGRTTFYSQPNFANSMVRVTRTQRFQVLAGQRGWAMIQFDHAGKAYIHLRILRNATFDPGASDPWHEFQRASVFVEEPGKVEARLKAATSPNPPVADSKTPSWKRYKDGWNLKPSRPTQASPEESEGTGSSMPSTAAARPSAEKKPHGRYPLLPPIGSESPSRDPVQSDAAPSDAAEKPMP